MTTVDRQRAPHDVPPGSKALVVFVHLSGTQTTDLVEAANAITAGPVSGAPVDFAVVNGDLAQPMEASGLRAAWLSVHGGRDVSEHVAAHLAAPGKPPGHGYGSANVVADIAYYAVDFGDRVRVIVLDTVNPHGGQQGSLDPAQLSWLRFQLTAAADRKVVLFSHHPLEKLVNDNAPNAHRRVLGDELRRVLLEHPSVVFWAHGDIDPRGQCRVIELLEAPDGSITIASTIIEEDAGGPDDGNVILIVPTAAPASVTSAHLSDSALAVADELLALIDGMEELPYGGELVSQRAHALQCATLAVGAGASDELVAAALLHDIGYTPWVQAAAPRRTHERAAAAYLLPLLGEHVGWLVGHHVAAKRYLVAVDDGYAATLSDASRRSLRAQDGPASAAEIAHWRTNPRWPEAVLLRSWDDRAKKAGAPTLPPSWFRNLLAGLAAAPSQSR